jgi:dolichol-phosphate hexosyltransferase
MKDPIDSTGVLAVMMPVYNEERTLATILAHVLARPEVGEVIAVDDGSTDRSWSILQEFATKDARVKPSRLESNQGKGAALRHAVGVMTMPFATVQDADLEYDPRDYPKLLQPLLEGQADAVFGTRGFSGQTAYNFWFVVGNQLVTFVCNVLYNCYISDLETGYKVLRSGLWRRLNLSGRRFDIEPDITVRVLRSGYRIHEVPIRYYARSRDEGKKLNWQDGVLAIAALVRLRLTSTRALFPQRQEDVEYHRRRRQELALHHPLLTSDERSVH